MILQCSYSDAIQYSCFDDDDDVSVDCCESVIMYILCIDQSSVTMLYSKHCIAKNFCWC